MSDYVYQPSVLGEIGGALSGPANTLAQFYARRPLYEAQARQMDAEIRAALARAKVADQEAALTSERIKTAQQLREPQVETEKAKKAYYDATASKATAAADKDKLLITATQGLSQTYPALFDFIETGKPTTEAITGLQHLAVLFGSDVKTLTENMARVQLLTGKGEPGRLAAALYPLKVDSFVPGATGSNAPPARLGPGQGLVSSSIPAPGAPVVQPFAINPRPSSSAGADAARVRAVSMATQLVAQGVLNGDIDPDAAPGVLDWVLRSQGLSSTNIPPTGLQLFAPTNAPGSTMVPTAPSVGILPKKRTIRIIEEGKLPTQ